MMFRKSYGIALLMLALCVPSLWSEEKRPNIVFLLADDLGWRDVGYHRSEIRTPNLDILAKSGAQLEQFYVMPVCSPTRACLMTGRYPIRMGLQSGVIRPWSQHGLPLKEQMLSEMLQKNGYYTSICGKWHLGSSKTEYLPTRRGFDHQYGHFVGALDYFTHMRMGGLDWHRNDKVLREEGYTTDLIGAEAVRVINQHNGKKPLFLYVPFNAPHTPLQAPKEYIAKYKKIPNRKRKIFAAMVTCMDDAVGKIVAALKKKGILDNTLIIFSSDNGGPTKHGADNAPLRGAKGTLYEGGTRVAAFATWSGKIKPQKVNEPLHMVDWYPTLLKRVGSTIEQKLPLDGKDIWPVLTEGKPSPHKEILLNAEPNRGAIRMGDWKLVVKGGLPRPMDGKGLSIGTELFNLKEDPSEKNNLVRGNFGKVRELMTRLNALAREAMPPKGGPKDKLPSDFKAPKVWGESDTKTP